MKFLREVVAPLAFIPVFLMLGAIVWFAFGHEEQDVRGDRG